MPNFHVHWLVAWQALDAVPVPAQAGRESYLKASLLLADEVYAALDAVTTTAGVPKFFSETLPARLKDWRKELAKTAAVRDEVTCFSAYMLGACGPDFWTVTSESGFGAIPDTASNHFDLGHYNRTHEQFRVSMERMGGKTGLQADVERSYFLGMATHVATDLVLHQLVNVSAGAYNLLKKRNWDNEHGPAPLVNPWNMHNKVEHFWDSYVRARYFGDLAISGETVLPGDGERWLEPLGLPLAETLVARARKVKDPAVRAAFLSRLVWQNPARHRRKQKKAGGEEIRLAIRIPLEQPLLFPAIVCDRILGDGPAGGPPLLPFIYDRVVNGTTGAYPSSLLYDDAVKEKASAQMQNNRPNVPGALNEVRKLTYFATAKNSKTDLDWSFLNYLTYVVSPDLERLRETANGLSFGKDAFYELPALSKFGARAVEVAKSFAGQLAGAYKSGRRSDLRDVGRFWNLDTGLGLEVQHVPSWTDREAITRLDFIHVFDGRLAASGPGATGPGYTRAPGPDGITALEGKASDSKDWTQVASPAFPIRTAKPDSDAPDGVARPFESLGKVEEADTKAFLDRIRVKEPPGFRWHALPFTAPPEVATDPESVRAEKRTGAWLDAFFAREESPRSWRHPLATVHESTQRSTWALQEVKHRLTLELRVPVLALSEEAKDDPALLFYCDDAIGKGKAAAAERSKWLEKAKLVGYQTDGVRDGPLRVFTARLLVNAVQVEDRIVAAGSWNNVIPYGANKQFYGRNFAIATGRKHVLVPTAGGLFDPTADLSYFSNVSPTEHVFLTIYPLVKTPTGVLDLFSKEDVTRADFDGEIRRITGLEWKKVVLFYQFDGGGLVQLDRAFIDGLDVAVQPG